MRGMALRGDQLREHTLYVAKNVFLEMGFERASMDVIAARAEISKRTLYAHFESKEKLYLAVIELVRRLFLNKIKMPADYPGDAAEQLTMFCGRFLEVLLFARTIQMCRLSIAEAARFPEGSAQYFDVIFNTANERLRPYLKKAFGLSPKASAEAAQKLLGRIVYPRFTRALFGMDELAETVSEEEISPDFDLKFIRQAVRELIASL